MAFCCDASCMHTAGQSCNIIVATWNPTSLLTCVHVGGLSVTNSEY